MKQSLRTNDDYIVLGCEKNGLLCQFILKIGFTSGVIASGHYHFHSTYEMHIPVIGNMHIMAEDKDILLQPGEVCVIPPDTIHYVYADENAFRIGFRFTFSRIGKQENIPHSLFEYSFGALTNARVVKNCPVYRKYLSVAADNLESPLPEFMTGDLLFLALYETASIISTSPAPEIFHGSTSDILLSEQIEEYLNNYYSHELHLGDLSKYLNLSNRQTERIIARLFGIPFRALVNKKRLTTARLLLKITDLPVEEIAHKVGFQDQNYFYRKFSAAFSTTPGKYRSQLK